MSEDAFLRRHLINHLNNSHAHVSFESAVGFPAKLRGVRVDRFPHTPWQILEHMRICQWDILEFSRDPGHVSPEFPAGYWPAGEEPDDDRSWDESVASFRRDLKAMQDLVADPTTELLTPIAHGQGQTVLREVLLVADHNSYHLGQLVLMRRLSGCWP